MSNLTNQIEEFSGTVIRIARQIIRLWVDSVALYKPYAHRNNAALQKHWGDVKTKWRTSDYSHWELLVKLVVHQSPQSDFCFYFSSSHSLSRSPTAWGKHTMSQILHPSGTELWCLQGLIVDQTVVMSLMYSDYKKEFILRSNAKWLFRTERGNSVTVKSRYMKKCHILAPNRIIISHYNQSL